MRKKLENARELVRSLFFCKKNDNFVFLGKLPDFGAEVLVAAALNGRNQPLFISLC